MFLLLILQAVVALPQYKIPGPRPRNGIKPVHVGVFIDKFYGDENGGRDWSVDVWIIAHWEDDTPSLQDTFKVINATNDTTTSAEHVSSKKKDGVDEDDDEGDWFYETRVEEKKRDFNDGMREIEDDKTREWQQPAFTGEDSDVDPQVDVNASHYWVPGFYFTNQRQTTILVENIKTSKNSRRPGKVSVIYRSRRHVVLEGDFDYWEFPFDKQAFKLKIETPLSKDQIKLIPWTSVSGMKYDRNQPFMSSWKLIYQAGRYDLAVPPEGDVNRKLRAIKINGKHYFPFSMKSKMHDAFGGINVEYQMRLSGASSRKSRLTVTIYASRTMSMVWSFFFPVHILLVIFFVGGFLTDTADLGTRSSIMLLLALTFEMQGTSAFSEIPSHDTDVWIVYYTHFMRCLLYTGSFGSIAVSLVRLSLGNRMAVSLNRMVCFTFCFGCIAFDICFTFISDATGYAPYTEEVFDGKTYFVCTNATACDNPLTGIGERPPKHGVKNLTHDSKFLGLLLMIICWFMYFSYLLFNMIEVNTAVQSDWTFLSFCPVHAEIDDIGLVCVWRGVLLATEDRRRLIGGDDNNCHEAFAGIEEFVEALTKTIRWMTNEDKQNVLTYLALLVNAEKTHVEGSMVCNPDMKLDFAFFKEHYERMMRVTSTWSRNRLFMRHPPPLVPGIVGGVSARPETMKYALERSNDWNKKEVAVEGAGTAEEEYTEYGITLPPSLCSEANLRSRRTASKLDSCFERLLRFGNSK